MAFRFYKQDKDAIPPFRPESGSAGYDLSSVQDVVIPGHSQAIADTGIVFEMPNDCYGRVAPRSGLAAKFSIDVLAGVVDSSYRSTVKVILYNHSEKEFVVKKGDRIAQLIFERIYTPNLFEVDSIEKLSTSDRGTNGFGSTGV
jgi:dUTP pyrophosphatase